MLTATAPRPVQWAAYALAHITARAFAANNKTVTLQLHIGVLHRVTGHPERSGQHSRGGEFQARVQSTVEDQGAQGALNSLVQIKGLKLDIVEPDFQGFKLKGFGHAVCSI